MCWFQDKGLADGRGGGEAGGLHDDEINLIAAPGLHSVTQFGDSVSDDMHEMFQEGGLDDPRGGAEAHGLDDGKHMPFN